MKTIFTEIEINASPEKVWQVLMEFDQYPDWNPFIRSISGVAAPSNTLDVFIQPPGSSGMRLKPVVLKHEPLSEFRWKGKLFISGIFDGEHYFKLEKISEGVTLFQHGEKFSGILVPFMGGILEKSKEGFMAMNTALKARCEQ